MMLIRYEKNGEIAVYDDGSLAHRHSLAGNEMAMMLGAQQAYYLIKNGKCSKCGKKYEAQNELSV